MKKLVMPLVLLTVFTTATVFLGCSDVISESDQEIEVSAEENVDSNAGRHCFGGHKGHGDNIGYGHHHNGHSNSKYR